MIDPRRASEVESDFVFIAGDVFGVESGERALVAALIRQALCDCRSTALWKRLEAANWLLTIAPELLALATDFDESYCSDVIRAMMPQQDVESAQRLSAKRALALSSLLRGDRGPSYRINRKKGTA